MKYEELTTLKLALVKEKKKLEEAKADLAGARSDGDFSENADYNILSKKCEEITSTIYYIVQQLSILADDSDKKRFFFVYSVENNSGDNSQKKMVELTCTEFYADPGQGRIYKRSLLAKTLLETPVGSIGTVNAPKVYNIKVLDRIEKPELYKENEF